MQPTPNTRPGRPPGASSIRTRAARHAEEAVEALASVAKDTAAPAADRVKAAEAILAHATEARAK